MTRVSKSKFFGGGPVTANVLTKALYRVVTCRPFILLL